MKLRDGACAIGFGLYLTLGCVIGLGATAATSSAVSPQSVAADASTSIPLDGAVNKLLGNPTVFNAFVTQLTNSGWTASNTNAILSFIDELHLRPVVFHTSGGSDSAVLGLNYDYNKSLQNKTLNPASINPAGLSFNISAKGTIAENASKNPNQFLESGISLHLFQALGGMTPEIVTSTDVLAARDAARTKAAQITRVDFQNDPAWIESGKLIMQYCQPQLSYDIAAHATLESDQKFSTKQWAYGGQLSLVYQDWKDASVYNWFNVLDIPFAAIRSFTIQSERFSFKPSGQAFPILIGGLDLVDPSDNAARLTVDPSKSAYPRFRGEVGFKTQVAQVFGTDLWLSASYRYFREISASSLIRAANMDEFNYFIARLDLPKGFNLSYSVGKLPLDVKSEHVYALGYTLNF